MSVRLARVIAAFTWVLCAPLAWAAAPEPDLARMTPQQIEAQATELHPAALYVLASRLLRQERYDDAVRWFYIGQLRYRFHLAVANDEERREEATLFGALSENVGRPINEYAFGDVDAAVRQIDAALAWDAEQPNGFTDKVAHAQTWQDVRKGLTELRNKMLAEKAQIREQRAANGLPNR